MRSNPAVRLMVGVVFFFFSLPRFSGHCLAQSVPPATPAAPPEHTLTIPLASHPQTNPQTTAPDYSKEAYVIDQYDTAMNFQADGTWQQVATVVVQVRCFTILGAQLGAARMARLEEGQ